MLYETRVNYLKIQRNIKNRNKTKIIVILKGYILKKLNLSF